jgi:hypothetical protein
VEVEFGSAVGRSILERDLAGSPLWFRVNSAGTWCPVIFSFFCRAIANWSKFYTGMARALGSTPAAQLKDGTWLLGTVGEEARFGSRAESFRPCSPGQISRLPKCRK